MNKEMAREKKTRERVNDDECSCVISPAFRGLRSSIGGPGSPAEREAPDGMLSKPARRSLRD